ncbi:MAG: TRL domain-containing protein [Bacteroidota bacterium]|nr:TRL domain-containing protein [Bacteroidota bacterium]
MKKIKIFVSAFAVAAILSSCSVTMPLTVSAAPIGKKVGISKTGILFGGWQLNKNFSIAEAAHNGKITGGVATADIKTSWAPVVKFFYYKKEIIVQGN